MKQSSLKLLVGLGCVCIVAVASLSSRVERFRSNVSTAAKTWCASKASNSSGTEVLFPPRDDYTQQFRALCEAEKDGIYVTAFRFTHAACAAALCDAFDNNVPVTCIVDVEDIGSRWSQALKLHEHGIPLYVYRRPRALMHNKYILFASQACVWTGSCNLTQAAQKHNRENIVILRGDRAAYQAFFEDYRALLDESYPLGRAATPHGERARPA